MRSVRSGLFIDNSVSREERKASLASSDLSVDAEEKTVFLPVKNDKTKKKDSVRQKKSKMLLSPSVPKKNNRRSSITPLDEDAMIGNQSRKENTKNNLLTTENAQDSARRKSVSTTDDEVMIVTTRDKYMERRRNTKGYAFENSTKPENEAEENFNENAKVRNERLSAPDKSRRKSMIDDEEYVQSFGKKGTKRKESLKVSATQSNGHRKSLIVDREDVRNTDRRDVKASESLIAPVGERRESLIAGEDAKTKTSAKSTREGKRASLAVDQEDMEESGKSRNNMNEEPIMSVSENGKSTEVQKTKRKKKKAKKGKKAKKKVDDLDELSDLEEETSASPKELTAHSDGIQPTPEFQRENSITLQDKKTKKKKKKRKQKEPVVTRQTEDSELSDEDVEDKIKEINANTLDPEIRQIKTKKQKNAISSRKKSLNPAAMNSDDEVKGDFRKSGNNVRAESTALHKGKRRKKPSLVLEDMEVK